MTWRQWAALIVVTVILSVLWVGVAIWGGSKVDRYLSTTTTTYTVDISHTEG